MSSSERKIFKNSHSRYMFLNFSLHFLALYHSSLALFVIWTYIYDYSFTHASFTISLVPGIKDTKQNKTKAVHMWGRHPNQKKDNTHVNK